MRTIVTLLTLTLLLLPSCNSKTGDEHAASGGASSGGSGDAATELATDEDKAFYAFGMNLSQQLGNLSLTEHDLSLLKAGLTDGVLKRTPKVDAKQYQAKFQEIAKARMNAGAATEKKAGQDFAEKAGTEKGAQKTASGAVYPATSRRRPTRSRCTTKARSSTARSSTARSTAASRRRFR